MPTTRYVVSDQAVVACADHDRVVVGGDPWAGTTGARSQGGHVSILVRR